MTYARMLPRLVLPALVACTLILPACKSKQVSPYTPSGKARPDGGLSGGFPEGHITEEFQPGTGGNAMSGNPYGPANEGLDATGGGRGTGSLYSNADSQSDAWKRQHGRSSPEMQPVFFDFDSALIRSDQVPAIEHNGAWLNANPSRQVVVEGNTDYHGTQEYNMALGERRAASAKNYLIELGVAAQRIRTISYGEERPLFLGGTESDEAGNRRADFVLE